MSRFRFTTVHAAGLLFAWTLKSFHSHAGAEDLAWILAPTCRLTELLSGIDFERENGAGWISHTHRMIVGAGCSGMNFLIISFLTLLFATVARVGSPRARTLCLPGCLAGAWALTITTNATRIILAVALYDMPIYGGVVTPARVHRAAGTVVYCLSLVLAYLAVDRLFARRSQRGSGYDPDGVPRRPTSALVPLAWYLGGMIGVPLVNRAWQDPTGRFLEHSAFVVVICTLVALTCLCARSAWSRRALGRRLHTATAALETGRTVHGKA